MRIETKEIDNKKIVAEVDTDDNSIDIAIVLDDEYIPITFNIAIEDNEKVILRKWLGVGADSEDETIYLSDVEDDEWY